MYFNGIPEMPITNVHVTGARIASTYGIQLNYADSVTLSDVRLQVAQGEPLTVNRVDHLTADVQ